jgi:hypothetical protein
MKNINSKGVALLLTILLVSLMLLLSIFFLNFSLTEIKISKSQTYGGKAYYLAEAGIGEIIWRLKNDAAYKNSFETNQTWTETLTRNNPFGQSTESYTVTIANSALARGTIISTGKVNMGNGNISQRVVKIQVYKAIGGSSIGETGGYADGNIDISLSKVNFYNGSAHSNNNFIVNGNGTIINVDADLKAVNNYNVNQFPTVNIAGTIYAANYPAGPADSIAMPAVDFNSSDPDSLKNIATTIYDEDDFENLLKNNQNLTLSGIIYVEGEIEVKGARNLTINGLLVAEEEFDIGEVNCWQGKCGKSSITVNHTAGQPSGIFSKEKIKFDKYTGDINLNGVAYATDQLDILNYAGNGFNVTGSLVSRKLTITSSWNPINITYDNEIVVSSLNNSTFSPIITIEHWEEEY